MLSLQFHQRLLVLLVDAAIRTGAPINGILLSMGSLQTVCPSRSRPRPREGAKPGRRCVSETIQAAAIWVSRVLDTKHNHANT